MNRLSVLVAMELVTKRTININGERLSHLVLIDGAPQKVTSPYIFQPKNHHLHGIECVDNEWGYPIPKSEVVLLANL